MSDSIDSVAEEYTIVLTVVPGRGQAAEQCAPVLGPSVEGVVRRAGMAMKV